MERPIIIWLKDDGKITKEMLEEVARKAYEQGYEEGKQHAWTITSPITYPYIPITWTGTEVNPKDITISYTDSTDAKPIYCG